MHVKEEKKYPTIEEMMLELEEVIRHGKNITCEYCGVNGLDNPYMVFHKDHIVPRKWMGSDEPENIANACSICNYRKSDGLNRKTLSGRVGHSFRLRFIDGLWHLPHHGL